MKQLDMKNETQQPKNIKDVYTENEHQFFNTNTHRMNSSIAPTGETGKRRAIELNSTPNIFLAQNKGKGPPGRQRSPVVIKPNRFHKPVRFDKTNDIISDPHSLPSNFGLRSFHPNGFETITDKKQNDYKFYKFNFLQLLNSITMKKQIFILILAVFASVTVAFGQAKHDSAPTTLSCTPGPFSPVPGVSYDYKAAINPTGGSAYWFATTKTSFITGGTLMPTTDMEASGGSVVKTATNYMTAAAAGTSPTQTSITWTAAGLAAAAVAAADPTKLFVVVKYDNSAAGCADNLKVYPIRPTNMFTVDILNEDPVTKNPGTFNTAIDQCFDKVQGAVYDAGAPGQVDYDFGTNKLYYEIIATNFSGAYEASLKLSGLQGKQNADIKWGYVKGTYPTSIATAQPDGTYVATGITADPAADVTTGVSIYVEVTVHNMNFEGTSNVPIILAVEGKNEAGQADVDNATCAVPGTTFEDIATQNLKARPGVTEVAPGTFLPIKP